MIISALSAGGCSIVFPPQAIAAALEGNHLLQTSKGDVDLR